MVLHHMTRGQLGDAVVADGGDKRTFYTDQQKKIAVFANKGSFNMFFKLVIIIVKVISF